jgi:hypothetical protein
MSNIESNWPFFTGYKWLNILNFRRRAALLFALLCPAFVASPSFADPVPDNFYAVPLGPTNTPSLHVIQRYGIPFATNACKIPRQDTHFWDARGQANRIYFLGLAEDADLFAWAYARDYGVRFFVGDQLGDIRLDYQDGSSEKFPLILGEGLWWGVPFYRFPDPFPTDRHLQKALALSLRLYPPAPVADGNYLAVITPKPIPLESIVIENTTDKKGTILLAGITVESAGTNAFVSGPRLSAGPFPSGFAKFVKEKNLRPSGQDEKKAQRALNHLRLALYTSDASFPRHVAPEIPADYHGPQVSFKGDVYADILQNAFYANVQDINDKVDSAGMYHTSTLGAPSWGGYNGFGTYRTNYSSYYGSSWCRDMGRSLQEITDLGYTNAGARCADYCLQTSKLWEHDPALEIKGTVLPPHWGRVANKPKVDACFENDGHGLVTMFLYKLWQRLPNRDEWLRARWPDVKASGDWILWQFAHPQISRAANGILYTTSECAGGKGYSVYADAICMDALNALAQMADSIGETNSASEWRDRADKMQQAIGARYVDSSQNYGRQWTLRSAGWPNSSTVLGPLIYLADYQGFAPQDDNPAWRSINEATYQRLVDTFQPFGFYGQAMGYGQGFVSQAALLLDRMQDATRIMDWTAKEIYDPQSGSYIVPEGAQINPTGRFWYHIGDLGNGVQEAENVKTLRLIIGVDDTHPTRLQFYPRLPYDWNEIDVAQYPVLFDRTGNRQLARLHYQIVRTHDGMKLNIACDQDLGPIAMRLGPFAKSPRPSGVIVNGKTPPDISLEHSGDSWWAAFTLPVGPSSQW